MHSDWTKRKKSLIRNLGYLFIWGDVYRVFFGFHALLMGPMDLETHLRDYLQIFFQILEWMASLTSFHGSLVQFVYSLPAAFIYFLGFTISTSVGIWLVRRSAAIGALEQSS